MAYYGDYGNYAVGADSARRKRPIDEFKTYTQQIKAGDFSSTFSQMGTMIGDALRAGQVRESSSAASSL